MDTTTEPMTWQRIDDHPDAERMMQRLFAHGNATFVTTESFEEHRRQRMKAHFDRARIMAAVQEHQAHRSRYEERLNIPAHSAYAHQRGTRWQPEQMCTAQWAALQQIRARDRDRRARKREHDRAVECELQTMTATPATPPREPVAA